MLQKVKTHRILAIVALAFALILGSGYVADAQTARTVFRDDALFAPSNPSPQVGEQVVFEINLGELLFLNLHRREILLVEWNFGDGTSMRRAALNNQVHAYNEAGDYTVQLVVITPSFIFSAVQEISVTEDFQPQFEQIEFGAITVSSFDFDGDNRLDDGEFFAVIDTWIAGRMSDDIFFLAVDIWVANDAIIATRTVGSAKAEVFSASVKNTSFGYTFSAQGVDSQQIAVQIFSPNGETIFEQEKSGSSLSWRGLDASGAPVANGTYFYIVKSIGADGEVHMSAPRAMAVMR